MKLGELWDRLREVDDALEEVAEAERSLGHGGSPETLRIKRERLADAQDRVARLRDEDVDPL